MQHDLQFIDGTPSIKLFAPDAILPVNLLIATRTRYQRALAKAADPVVCTIGLMQMTKHEFTTSEAKMHTILRSRVNKARIATPVFPDLLVPVPAVSPRATALMQFARAGSFSTIPVVHPAQVYIVAVAEHVRQVLLDQQDEMLPHYNSKQNALEGQETTLRAELKHLLSADLRTYSESLALPSLDETTFSLTLTVTPGENPKWRRARELVTIIETLPDTLLNPNAWCHQWLRDLMPTAGLNNDEWLTKAAMWYEMRA